MLKSIFICKSFNFLYEFICQIFISVPKSGAVSRPVGAEDLTHLRNYTAPPNNGKSSYPGPEGTASTGEG
jgi:hypothetical protein